ncbi:hypothetical protein FQA47_008660 [Oryzias melastigma]|uniref:Uncharacterized protein n=1 Tax=Oryzias melastigma TaxID=30732 RepID=A0A834CFV8_ORYME|nr:hypothetical protein FQA47_008660 [Oryzias melastigma]
MRASGVAATFWAEGQPYHQEETQRGLEEEEGRDGSECLCVYSDRPRQQTLRHRLDHSQAGRRNTARQSDWQRGQATERVNQRRMSKGAVRNRAPE